MPGKTPIKLEAIGTIQPDRADDLFICFASFEERCLGCVKRLSGYSAKQSIVLRISDEPNKARENYLSEIKTILSGISKFSVIETQHSDPIVGILALSRQLQQIKADIGQVSITLDITTFPKRHLFLTLKLLDKLALLASTRMLYTDPKLYGSNINKPLSEGLKEIAVFPTFTGKYDPQQKLTLVLFLGYEGHKALALWENIEPNKTIAIIPKPAYHPEWEGKTEEMNPALLSALDKDSILYADSRDPTSTFELLEEIIMPDCVSTNSNLYIAPLGTKLQAVGIYYFVAKYPDMASVIYASPLRHNEEFRSTGIGSTWLL
jgi:hypothetical protein